VLDFFAGSGTTGHALQVLNHEDRGRRSFILCTNNENNIAQNVTQKRLEATQNKTDGFEEITGLDFNLNYFQIATQLRSDNFDEKMIDFAEKVTSFLQIIENTFEDVMKNESFEIFKSGEKCLGVYTSLDPRELESFKDILLKQGGNIVAYIATLDQQGMQSFDLYGWEGITVNSLPSEIISRMEVCSSD
jgi:hypothetical protein